MQPDRDGLREEERELDYYLTTNLQVEKHSTSFQHHSEFKCSRFTGSHQWSRDVKMNRGQTSLGDFLNATQTPP